MTEPKRQPAAHSGACVKPLVSGTSQVPLSQAATSEMNVAKEASHPAPGCSPKHVGEVKAPAKE